MNNIKRYFKYLIWIILFYVFSNVLIYFGIKNRYNNRKQNEIENNTTTANEIADTGYSHNFNLYI